MKVNFYLQVQSKTVVLVIVIVGFLKLIIYFCRNQGSGYPSRYEVYCSELFCNFKIIISGLLETERTSSSLKPASLTSFAVYLSASKIMSGPRSRSLTPKYSFVYCGMHNSSFASLHGNDIESLNTKQTFVWSLIKIELNFFRPKYVVEFEDGLFHDKDTDIKI